MPLTIVRQDITKLKVDAIVNAANTDLAQGGDSSRAGGVCGTIFSAAGALELQAACDKLAPIKTGEAVIAPGFAPPAKYVIHAVGPVYRDGAYGEEMLLRDAYTNSLRLAVDNKCESVAFSLISSEIYGKLRKNYRRIFMNKKLTTNIAKRFISGAVICVLAMSIALSASAKGIVTANTSTEVAAYFEKTKANKSELIAFLHEMPKGADLHSHASATIEAESVLEYAAAQGFGFDRKSLAFVKETTPVKSDTSVYFTNATLKSTVSASSTLSTGVRETVLSEILEAVSMRNYEQSGESGHDHFFQYFFRVGDVSVDGSEIYRLLFTRAIKENIGYLELMTNMKTKADYDSVIKIKDEVIAALKTSRKLDVNFIATINRNADNTAFKTALDKAIALYDNPDTHTVGITILSAEDDLLSQKNFDSQMEILDKAYKAHVKAKGVGINFHLHAGELTLDYSEYLAMTDRISKSIELGHAKIIGHGVSIAWNENVYELLKKMRDEKIGVTICPTSNEAILGVSGGNEHPFKLYWNADVPVAIATDDEGLSRSNLTNEYAKIAEWFGLKYGEMKWLAFNSVEMSFLSGVGIFKDKNYNLTESEFQKAKAEAISSNSAKGIKECEVYEGYVAFEHSMEVYIKDFF